MYQGLRNRTKGWCYRAGWLSPAASDEVQTEESTFGGDGVDAVRKWFVDQADPVDRITCLASKLTRDELARLRATINEELDDDETFEEHAP